MKIVRFAADNKVRYGILDGESIKVIEDNGRIRLRNWSNFMMWSEGEISFLSGVHDVV